MSGERTLTAAVHQEDDWFAAQCLEVDVASQGESIPEAVELYLRDARSAGDLDPVGDRVPDPGVSPALADLPYDKVAKALEAAGYRRVRSKGSHVVLTSPSGRTVIVPKHRTVKRGTLASIPSTGRVTTVEFQALLG